MRYRVLGPLRLAASDGEPVELGPKLRRLLAVLLVHANEAVTVDQLATCLWGEEQPRDPRSALQVHVVRLRRHLGDDVRTVGSGYLLVVPPGELDAEEFARLEGRARSLMADGLQAEALRTLEAALALWHGEPLQGLGGTGLDDAVRRLQRLRRRAEDDHADLSLALGHGEELLELLEERVAADPARVRSWGQLARALVASGRPSAARELQTTARSMGLDVPEPGSAPALATAPGVAAGRRAGDAGHDELRADLRALLTAAGPHALPTSVLHRATGRPASVVEAALRQDPAISHGGRPPTWRLRDDVDGTPVADTADRLAAAAVADGAAAGAALLGPDLRGAAATCRVLAPLLEDLLRAGVQPIATIAAMGRWWTMEARADLGRLVAAAVLQGTREDLFVWLDAHDWALDLAGRVGDGRLVELLLDAFPPAPEDPRAAALWAAGRGRAAELEEAQQDALAWFLDAADRWQALGDEAGEIASCCNGAHAARLSGQPELARRLIERARALPLAAVAPLPRHFVTATDAALHLDGGEFGEARDLALAAEVLVRGIADRLADRAAVLAAEAAFFRHDHAEVRITLGRTEATPDARTRTVAAMVRAEVENAEGQPARAVRALETLWGRDGDLLRLGIGGVLAGTYARIAAGLGHAALAVALLESADAGAGPWGRLDDELRDELGVVAGREAGGHDEVLGVIRRAREELVAAVGVL